MNRVKKQLDALVTTIIFSNIVFLGFSFFGIKSIYWNIGVNLFLLVIFKLISKYEVYINGIFEASKFSKQLNDMLK